MTVLAEIKFPVDDLRTAHKLIDDMMGDGLFFEFTVECFDPVASNGWYVVVQTENLPATFSDLMAKGYFE